MYELALLTGTFIVHIWFTGRELLLCFSVLCTISALWKILG